ncbi:MAG TPA: L-threonylcarbamoyladenylate synthase [Bryobacteraceae bacterium]|jgi:L-threonylcarbamoyladenylate synthase
MQGLSIKQAAEKIRSGGLVAFPTETVYGLGANALDAAAVQKIYDLKGRPAASPLIVHVASIEMAREIVSEWPPLTESLAQRWWPGPLTLVLPKRPMIPDIVTAGLPTLGVRMPNHPIALELIKEAGVPIAAPSANKFMELSPTTAEHVRVAFGESVEVLDGGPAQVGIESTIVGIENGEMKLLRPGMISLGELQACAVPSSGEPHPAPGMHPRHYSPRTRLLLVEHPRDLPDRRGAYVWRKKSGLAACSHRMPENPAAYAAQLYAVLHKLDQEGWPWIGVEAPPDTPAWAAIRDRLQRASER